MASYQTFCSSPRSSDEDLSSNSIKHKKEVAKEDCLEVPDTGEDSKDSECVSDDEDSELDYGEYIIESDLLHRFIKVLKTTNEAEKTKSYFAEGTINSDDVSLTVIGMGSVTFPIKFETATKLTDMATLASFGHKEQTKQDQNVRDTYIISNEKLNVVIKNLNNVLNDIKMKLSLNEDSNLEAHLHNLLIYKQGQHFDFHQDTEKMDNMVATLVVALPSAHVGGNLVIKHLNKSHIFSTEMVYENNVKYIAFYSDCYHKVDKVKDGFRIVLTYNLVLRNSQFQPTTSCNHSLINILREYFSNSQEDCTTTKLIYLFDHCYTKGKIKFSNLKGHDIVSASALVSAAKELNLVVRLVLADIKDCWSFPMEEPEHLTTTLTSWRDENDQLLKYKPYNASEREICWSKHNVNFKAHKTDKNVYLGNEGVTEDKWYKRAAVILWPQSSDVAMQFELDYDGELNKLKALIKSPNNLESVQAIIKKAGHILFVHTEVFSTRLEHVRTFVKLATYIADPKEALKICKYFYREVFNYEDRHLFLKLKNAYGSSWCLQLMNESGISKRPYSLSMLIKFIKVLKRDDRSIVEQILRDGKANAESHHPKNKHFDIYGTLVKMAYKKKCFDILEDVLQTIMSKEWEVQNMAQFYIQHCNSMHLDAVRIFKDRVVTLLRENIDKYKDICNKQLHWLSKINFGDCKCKDCSVMIVFLKSDEKVKEFFYDNHRRQHLLCIFENRNRDYFSMNIEKRGKWYCLAVEKKFDIINSLEAKWNKQLKCITEADRDEGRSGSKFMKRCNQSDITGALAKKTCT